MPTAEANNLIQPTCVRKLTAVASFQSYDWWHRNLQEALQIHREQSLLSTNVLLWICCSFVVQLTVHGCTKNPQRIESVEFGSFATETSRYRILRGKQMLQQGESINRPN